MTVAWWHCAWSLLLRCVLKSCLTAIFVFKRIALSSMFASGFLRPGETCALGGLLIYPPDSVSDSSSPLFDIDVHWLSAIFADAIEVYVLSTSLVYRRGRPCALACSQLSVKQVIGRIIPFGMAWVVGEGRTSSEFQLGCGPRCLAPNNVGAYNNGYANKFMHGV